MTVYLKRVSAKYEGSCKGCYFFHPETGAGLTCFLSVDKLCLKYDVEKIKCSNPDRIFVQVKNPKADK